MAIACACLPTFLLWLFYIAILSLSAARLDTSPSPTRPPNPAKAPAFMLGPLDMLVHADPSFAGIGIWLVVLEVAVLVPLGVWASASTVSLRSVVLVSALAGVFLSSPWIYATAILLGTGR